MSWHLTRLPFLDLLLFVLQALPITAWRKVAFAVSNSFFDNPKPLALVHKEEAFFVLLPLPGVAFYSLINLQTLVNSLQLFTQPANFDAPATV